MTIRNNPSQVEIFAIDAFNGFTYIGKKNSNENQLSDYIVVPTRDLVNQADSYPYDRIVRDKYARISHTTSVLTWNPQSIGIVHTIKGLTNE